MTTMTDCTTARELVAELEAMPLGQDTGTLVSEAATRLELERATPLAVIFPSDIQPTTADALASYGHHIGRLGAAGYGDRLAEIHGRAVSSHPALAVLCRSVEAGDDVGQAAANLASPANPRESHAIAQARAAGEARSRYQLAIARQLGAAPGHPLGAAAAEVLALDQLATRLHVARARHADHAKLEAARLQAERSAALVTAAQQREAAEYQAELEAATALVAPHHSEERHRLALVVQLRRRLRASTLPELRVAGSLYVVKHLAFSVGAFTAGRCAAFLEALDLAEGRERPAAPMVAEQPLEMPPEPGTGTTNALEIAMIVSSVP